MVPAFPSSDPPIDSSQTPAEHVVVLGLGQMGLVCGGLLGGTDHRGPLWRPGRVTLWGHQSDEVDRLAQSRSSPRLSHFELPSSVRVTADYVQVLRDASLVVSAIPVQFIREAWMTIGRALPPGVGVVSVAKGIENTTLLRPTQIIEQVLRNVGADGPDTPHRPLAALSGPTIAAELARCLPAAMIAASEMPHFAQLVQRTFATSWMRVYTLADVLGVELAGAVKNVIAIAAGVVDGLQAGNNAKSALLARGLAEIVRLGTAMGAEPGTFFGVAGVGDLATSCFSREGRNRSCGEALGRGAKLGEYLKGSPFVVEGVATCRSVMDLAARYQVEMPIVAAVHSILFEDVDPIEAISQLMAREQKAERVG